MGNSFTVYSFFTLTSCLLTGVFIAWLLYGRSSALTPRLRVVLAVIRISVISLILWLLFSPLIRQVSYQLEKPIVIIAQDNSQSVGNVIPLGFDPEKYKKDLQQLADNLSAKYDVRRYSFSDHTVRGLDFHYYGKLTDLSQLMSTVGDEFINKNVGAFILATDGIFNRGGNPASAVENLRVPIFTVAMGDTIAKKDLLIANISTNDLVYLDNDFNAEVLVQAYQCRQERTILTVTEDGKKLYEQEIKMNDDLVSKNIPVTLRASKLGLHQYTFNVSALRGEVSVQNNSREVWIEVIDDRQKILIAAEGPHPDLSALRQALSINKHFDVSLVMKDQLNTVNPKDYSLIVLYQFPDLSAASKILLEKINAVKVPVWYIVGLQTDMNQFNTVQKNVSFLRQSGPVQYHYSDISSNLSVFELDPRSRKVIENFDPLQFPAGEIKPSGAIQPILDQRAGKAGINGMQLFFMNAEGRKTAYLVGEGLWKWKLSEAKESNGSPVFNSLMGKVVQYLSVKDDKRKFIVSPSKPSFDENESVLFNATLYNDSYQPVNTPDVSIELKNQQGKTYHFNFSKFEAAYQLDAGLLPAGRYTYKANATLGSQKYVAGGSFFIKALMVEFQQTIANHQLLYQLSDQTGGKMVYPAQLVSLKEELEKGGRLKTLSYEDRKYEGLINFRWLFACIVLLLSVEWFVRKRNGAI